MLPSALHPVIVSARLDTPLSRWLWLWLVKRFLAGRPPYIMPFFLRPAFAVVSVIAFVAILFTAQQVGAVRRGLHRTDDRRVPPIRFDTGRRRAPRPRAGPPVQNR
jgi:hypothetical protein